MKCTKYKYELTSQLSRGSRLVMIVLQIVPEDNTEASFDSKKSNYLIESLK